MASMFVTVTMNPALDKTVTVKDFQTGKLNRVETIRMDPGGKGINVSKAISTYGVKQLATGILAGRNGERVSSMLSELGIHHHFMFVPGETRTNMKIRDKKTGIITEVNEPGHPIHSKDREAFLRRLEGFLIKANTLVLSGSLPASVPRSFYADCVKIAEKMGARTIIDADGEALKLGVQSKPYAIKPNQNELECLVGKTLDTHEKLIRVIKQLGETGIPLILVSMGAKGAILYNHNEIYITKPLPVRVQSTVGAGDAMVAAMAYCIKMNLSPQEMAQVTTAAGCLTAGKEGSAMASWKEIKKAWPDVWFTRSL